MAASVRIHALAARSVTLDAVAGPTTRNGCGVKIITEIELEGSEVVEVVARALYAHVNSPGADYTSVKWPPKNKPTLMAYWNKAKAVVRAQHAYVEARERDRSECRGPPPLTVGTVEGGVTRD